MMELPLERLEESKSPIWKRLTVSARLSKGLARPDLATNSATDC
jgi:hypothetical protein